MHFFLQGGGVMNNREREVKASERAGGGERQGKGEFSLHCRLLLYHGK